MRTTFDATYFAPKVGDVVQGTVSRLGQDHVALLVLGIFNASVPHEQPGHTHEIELRYTPSGVNTSTS